MREAHDKSKEAQKINYDKDKYDVEFAIGSKVLWFAQDPKDKLYMKWYGPYTVTQKLSDIVYEIKDELDGEKRKVTVSQIVPFKGEVDSEDEESNTGESVLKSLQFDRFVVFARCDDKDARQIHVGRVVDPYNSLTGSVEMHHYVDLGPRGDNLAAFSTKALKGRILLPELADGDGASYTLPRKGKRSLRPDTQDVVISYNDHNLKHMLAKNFYLDSNGRIPSDVLLEVRKQQEKLGLPVSK